MRERNVAQRHHQVARAVCANKTVHELAIRGPDIMTGITGIAAPAKSKIRQDRSVTANDLTRERSQNISPAPGGARPRPDREGFIPARLGYDPGGFVGVDGAVEV